MSTNQGNMNLLEEARRTQVKHFLYVSVISGENMRELKMIEAREKFVDELKDSGLDSTIIRPTGFFSDMEEFLDMALKGGVYLIGDGEQELNPIAGEDLANVCVDAVENKRSEVNVGGPEILSHTAIAETAFGVLNKKVRIRYLPVWLARFVKRCLQLFTPLSVYGPVEFFLTAFETSHVGEQHGRKTLKDFYTEVWRSRLDAKSS